MDFKVGLCLALRRLGFAELRVFSQVIVVKFLNEGLVCRFGYDTFFFENGKDTHGLAIDKA